MKKIIILTMIATASVFLLMGFNTNSKRSLIHSGEVVVEKAVGKDVDFLKVANSGEPNDEGLYIYKDDNYFYYVDVIDNYLSKILPAKDFQNKTENATSIDADSAEIIAKDYFSAAIGHLVVGEVGVTTSELEGLGFVSEIIEKLNNIETGTKASLVVNETGDLLSAVFIKGDPARIENLDLDMLISEDEAIVLAIQALESDLAVKITENNPTNAGLKTFKGKTFWQLTFPIEIITQDEETDQINYCVQVDAMTGEVLEIIHDI